MQAAVTTMSLCQLQANLTALSCTLSIPTQQHLQIELASGSEWRERLRDQKKEAEAVILCPIRLAQNHLVGR